MILTILGLIKIDFDIFIKVTAFTVRKPKLKHNYLSFRKEKSSFLSSLVVLISIHDIYWIVECNPVLLRQKGLLYIAHLFSNTFPKGLPSQC